MDRRTDYLVVGGGMAADAAARGIRDVDPDGTILIVGADEDPPVRRPALSKDLWTDDDTTPTDVLLGTADATGATLLTGTEVTGLDPDAHQATTASGTIAYRVALLATGGRPRVLDDVPPGDRVVYFRTLADYRRLRRLAQRGSHVVVVGGGYIGSEVTAALAQNGVDVTMVFPEDAPGGGRFVPEIADQVSRRYADAGVDLRQGRTVTSTMSDDDEVTVTLDDGTTLTATAVVVGLGVTPDTSLAEAAGIALCDDGGVLVDEHLRTSAPDVLAAGDVASFVDPRLGRRRVEHEDNATTMGEAAGRVMAGEDVAYQHTPFFYSDLFDLGYEAVGRLDPTLETVVDHPTDDGTVVYHLDDGRVVGVLLWNVWDSVDAARDLVARPDPPADLTGLIPKGDA